jgi:hypothetical protein
MSTKTVPCSRCGSLSLNLDCPRCEEGRIASDSEEALTLFQEEEARRMSSVAIPACRDRLPQFVALVGCSAHKNTRERTLPARKLYTGHLFRQGFRHAMATADDVHILSGLHGLVAPHEQLAPYDYDLATARPETRAAWGGRVVGQLLTAYPLTHLVITFFAGRHYVDPIIASASEENVPWEFETPLAGLDLFQRINWYKQHAKICSSNQCYHRHRACAPFLHRRCP